MIDKEKRERKMDDAEEIGAILEAVSRELPALIKGLVGSVFSEQAGRDMGKAAAAFYSELKQGGMPDETAVKMTENYVSVFTNLGQVMKNLDFSPSKKSGDEIEKEPKKKIKEKLAERTSGDME